MSQPFTQQLTTYEGANYAPLKPFLSLRDNKDTKSPFASHYLVDALKNKYTDLLKRDERARKEMISAGQLIALFIEGKQILDWNPYTQAYTPRKLKKTDPNKIKAVNFMQYYCSNWQSKWGTSDPDIIVSPLSNKDTDVSRAKKANSVVDHLEYKMYDSWYNYHEGMMAQCFGTYLSEVVLCTKDGLSAVKNILGEKEVQIGEGFGKCHDCEYSGKGTEFNQLQPLIDEAAQALSTQPMSLPVCPQCGSTGVYHEPPATQMMEQVVGQENIALPNIKANQIAFPASAWDYRFRAEDSSWFITEEEVNPGSIGRSLGNFRLPEGESPNHFGLEVVAALAQVGSPINGRSDTGIVKNDSPNPVRTRMFLSADDMHDIIIKGENHQGELTVENQTLPVGKRMSELFPDGCCVVGYNGLALITSITAGHHSKTITSGVYHMKALSGTGRGVGDAVEVQKRFNREDSQYVRARATQATPATLWAEGAISQNDKRLLGQPDVDIPIKIQNFPEVRSIRDLVYPMDSRGIDAGAQNYTYNHLSSFMQLAYHITDFSNGLNPRIKNDTATGAEILDANADALFSPTLSIKGDVRLKQARKAFNMFVDNTPVKRFVSYRKAGKQGGIEVSGEDVKGDYEWYVMPGSEAPKNRLTRRKDAMAFYGLFGGVTGYIQAKMQSPQEVQQAERAWDMDFASGDFDDISAVCRRRLEFAKDLMEKAQGLREQAQQQFGVQVPAADPMMLMPEVRPTMLVTESQHIEKAKWFSELLDTEEGLEATDEERNLLNAFILAHADLAKGQAVGMAQGEAEVAGASQPEDPNAEQNAQIAQQEAVLAAQESEKAEAQAAQDAEIDGAKTAIELVEADKQRAHEMELKKIDARAKNNKKSK